MRPAVSTQDATTKRPVHGWPSFPAIVLRPCVDVDAGPELYTFSCYELPTHSGGLLWTQLAKGTASPGRSRSLYHSTDLVGTGWPQTRSRSR